MNEVLYMEKFKNFHTKHSMFTAPDAHMHTAFITSIQPANQAVEHLINSYDQYWKRKRKAVNAYKER